MIRNRQWAALSMALDNGAPAHAVAGETKLNLFEEFLKEAYQEIRQPNQDLVNAGATERLRDQAFLAFVKAWKGNDPDRPTPLTLTSLMGQPRWVRMLLEAGHDPNEVGEEHSPATALARRNLQGKITVPDLRNQPESGWDEEGASSRAACLDALLEAGLDLDRPAWRGACPLLLACLAKDTPMVLVLLARGASPEGKHGPDGPPLYRLSPLEAAIVTHNETAVSALLRAGASPLRPSSLSSSCSLVELAGGLGQAGMLSALASKLESKAHPELLKAWRFALVNGNEEVVDWFLVNGRRWDEEVGDSGYWPIHLAASHAQGAIIERLEREGASLDQKDANGLTGWQHLRSSPSGMALLAELAMRRSVPDITSNVVALRPRDRF